MPTTAAKPASTLLIVIAFATVYIVWGSTYFFIRMADTGGFPPFLLGAVRFSIAGVLLLIWCFVKGEKLFDTKGIINAAICGILLLFIGNGAVIWSEQTLPSGMVAILVSSSPIWFVVLDKPNWKVNFKSKSTVIGLIVGFGGVLLLFSEQLKEIFHPGAPSKLPWMLLLLTGSIAWAAGSLYSKYKLSAGSSTVNTTWQMLAAGIAFIPASLLHHEFDHMQANNISAQSWLALSYLVIFGSIAGFSAYVWLLKVCKATQVSTYAYVNPVIAVVLGVVFAHEYISAIQVAGLVIILGSVLLINLSKYRKDKTLE